MSVAAHHLGRPAGALRAPLGAAAVVAAATAYVATVDPSLPGHYPTCPLLAVTGLYCPLCGSLRAVHELAHGDLLAALGRNPLTVVGLAVVVALWARWAVRAGRGLPTRLVLPANATPVLLVVLVVFGVARNLPFGSGLAP